MILLILSHLMKYRTQNLYEILCKNFKYKELYLELSYRRIIKIKRKQDIYTCNKAEAMKSIKKYGKPSNDMLIITCLNNEFKFQFGKLNNNQGRDIICNSGDDEFV